MNLITLTMIIEIQRVHHARSTQDSSSSQYQKYAKEFMTYRQKNNFVPSLSLFTGRYAKANIKRSIRANEPRKEYNRDRVKTRRYYED